MWPWLLIELTTGQAVQGVTAETTRVRGLLLTVSRAKSPLAEVSRARSVVVRPTGSVDVNIEE